jgi:hypothetical protein
MPRRAKQVITIRHPKSSAKARELIRAALKRTDDNHLAASKLLQLPNSAQMDKMLAGTIHDTPAMKLQIKLADERARRARLRLPRLTPNGRAHLEVDELDRLAEQCEATLRSIRSLLRNRPPAPTPDSTGPPAKMPTAK